MSRKHFAALATEINSNLTFFRNANGMSEGERLAALHGAENIARAVANVCAEANPRFDIRRFLTACGIN